METNNQQKKCIFCDIPDLAPHDERAVRCEYYYDEHSKYHKVKENKKEVINEINWEEHYPIPNEVNNENREKWRDETFEKLYALISKGHEAVINHEEVEEYKQEVKSFLSSTISNAVKERDDAIEKLKFIIRDINSYEPDGEVNTLCEQACEIINLIKHSND